MLYLWTDAHGGSAVSQDGSFANPLVFASAPTGGTQEVQLFLRHTELSGDLAESSYDVTVTPSDDFGTDESTWIQLAHDVAGSPGTYGSGGAPLTVGDILIGQIYTFWAKITIPSMSPGAKQDIYLKVEASQTPSDKSINLSTGTFTRCSFDNDSRSIVYDVTHTDGNWLSTWYDISTYSNISNVSYETVGTNVYIEYRTSSDSTDATATAWVSNPADLDITKGFIQFRARFVNNGLVGTTGLIQRVYGNTDFSVFKAEYIGAQIPFTGDPGQGIGPTKSVRWSGYFYAGTRGSYGFRIVSNDGHRMYINGSLLLDNWTTTSGSATVATSGSVFLTAGYHAVKFEYFHVDGDDDIKTYVTPPSSSEVSVQLTNFIPYDPQLKVDFITLKYAGPKTTHYDVKIYAGPDVPTLVSPEDGAQTRLFAPTLTAHQVNSQYIEFQLDTSTTFDSPNLADFIVAASGFGTDVSGAPPDGTRPSGTYYWRARGIYNVVNSEWSDWRVLIILELASYPQFFYLNVNNGLATHDSIEDNRHMYLNTNIGLAPHDPIGDDRFVYLNVDIEYGLGKIIYPFYDDTRSRKLDFPGDDGFIQN